MTVIDGNGLTLGRMGSIVAKRLLNGEKIDIVNCEKILVSGNKKAVVDTFKNRLNLKSKVNPRRGPKYPRTPEQLVKRSIRGMLPYKKQRGISAYKKLKVHYGTPENFKELETIEDAKTQNIVKYTTIYNICKEIGGIKA